MIRSISSDLRLSLLGQPESGMGYQYVEAEYFTGLRERLVALNASFLAKDWSEITQATSGYQALFEKRLKTAAAETVLRGNPPAIRSLRISKATAAVREGAITGPASDVSPTETEAGKEFRRFSAFENDLRITADLGLLAGTYATTAEDGAKVKTGEQAVQRYALPNSTPACHEFAIRPPARTVVQQGIVQPANSQPGGGVEVIFTKGSPAGTVTDGRTLPER